MKLHIIRKGQIWQSKTKDNIQLEICGKKRDKWLTKVLTNKPGVYNGTHTMADYTLYKKFKLQQ